MLPAPTLFGTAANVPASCEAVHGAATRTAGSSGTASTFGGYSQTVISELVAARGSDSLDLWARTINPQFARVLRTIGFDRTWARAEGAYLWDDDGNRFLDLLGGFGMFNVGRNNPRVRDALIETLELDLPGSVQLGASPLPPLLAEELLRRTPSRLERVLFTSTGTEAVEAALKLGRAATGRTRVLSALHGFHGLTLGSLSANGNPEFSDRFGPLLPGFDRVAFGDLDALEAKLRREDVALFLVEPVQGKGVNLPPPGYLEGAQELCRRFGTLFCVDEVQTGFGRTGKLFALEHWGLEPDLVPVSKSLSGGYVPVGALLMSKWVHERVFDSMENAFSHGSTFAPNELAMAAGLATLRELDEQELVARSERLGARLLELTMPLVDRYDVVRDVRGLGLMWAIEFGEPRSRRRTYRLVERLQHGLFAQLVILPLFTEHRILSQVAGHGIPVVKGLPPLTLDDGDVDWVAEALDAAIAKAQRLPRAMAGFALTAAGLR
jgi:ornithine--oxo-acid transaminase